MPFTIKLHIKTGTLNKYIILKNVQKVCRNSAIFWHNRHVLQTVKLNVYIPISKGFASWKKFFC
jgi:hypothetical protein